MISRRTFLARAFQTGLGTYLLGRNLFALDAAGRSKTLVVIFQRGAMDGLSLVPPVGDSYYYDSRPSLALGKTGESAALALDGYFGLHPAAGALKRFWDEGSLAFVHQSGFPDATRSHFDAQDFMESGAPGKKNISDGFLNRAMIQKGRRAPLAAVALQPTMPRILQGVFPAISMNSIHDYKIQGDVGQVQGFDQMYQQAVDNVFRGVGGDIFRSIDAVHRAAGDHHRHAGEQAKNKKHALAKRLLEISELIKGNAGVEVAVTDVGGWDTHVNQGSEKGQLAGRFTELADSLQAFADDLGPHFENVCVVAMTEFGRTVKENGNRGTDHGHGSVMTVLGGKVAGKKVYADWKDLKPANLFEGRDVPITTDYRDVMAEILTRHLEISNLNPVFPNYPINPRRWLGIVKA